MGIRALENVSTDVFELIERLQPFNKLHERDPLWILHELWNQDKHRSLIVVAEPRKALREVIRAPGGRELYENEVRPRHSDDPREVLRLAADSDAQVEFEPNVPLT